MSGKTDLTELIRTMSPILDDTQYIFTVCKNENIVSYLDAWAVIRENEGITAIIDVKKAEKLKMTSTAKYRRITLNVHSSLEAVGLTAAVATKLAEHGISANVVAGYYHDHIFVQDAKADEALQILKDFSSGVKKEDREYEGKYTIPEFRKVNGTDKITIDTLSVLASEIVKRHFDPIIGAAQNDYMIAKFQSADAITRQLAAGYRYYLVAVNRKNVGFMAFFPKNEKMYLSKFYIRAENRGQGIARKMFDFVRQETDKEKLSAIFLNVNRNNTAVINIYEHFGFRKVREEKNDIGNGYVMDDFVLEYNFNTK